MPDLAPADQYRVVVVRPGSPNRGREGVVFRTYHSTEFPGGLPEKLKVPGWDKGPPMLWVRLDGEPHPIPYDEADVRRIGP